jgi:hypothetical protein
MGQGDIGFVAHGTFLHIAGIDLQERNMLCSDRA